jgi:hypothetical protein
MIEDLKRRYAKLQGLLNSPMNQPGGLLGNIPQSALLGSAIFGQGMQGKDPFSALLPAVNSNSSNIFFFRSNESKKKISRICR